MDGATGSYSLPVLVVNAQQVAPYAALPGARVFAADTLAAGKYSLSRYSNLLKNLRQSADHGARASPMGPRGLVPFHALPLSVERLAWKEMDMQAFSRGRSL